MDARSGTTVLAVAAMCCACGDDDVRFGDPDTLRAGCALAACAVGNEPMPEVCPTWRGDIHPLFVQQLGCSAPSPCHGDGGAEPPLAEDAAAAYQSLAAYERQGRAYLGADDPQAYLLCNLDGLDAACFGDQMPPGGVDADTRALIAGWARCGMRDDGVTSIGGAR